MKNVFSRSRLVFVLLPLAGVCLAPAMAAAQSLSFTSGQPVMPAYEGWEQAADGAKYFVFGYMNRNWEEEIDVPVGPDNGFDVGGADQGQPTHFLPRRNRFVFRVPVPAGFGDRDELVWTLTTKGKTAKAYASLRADYKIDDVVIASETGALGAGTSSPTIRSNKAPTVTILGDRALTVKAGQPLSLAATVVDDGIPKAFTEAEVAAALAARARAAANAGPGGEGGRGAAPATGAQAPARPNPRMAPPTRVTVGKNLGLHLSWFVYRGGGKVVFSPAQIKSWEDTRTGANSPWAPIWFAPPLPADGKVTAAATFERPGTYVLRALADDGALTSSQDVTVTVVP